VNHLTTLDHSFGQLKEIKNVIKYMNITHGSNDEIINIKLPHFNNNFSDILRNKKLVYIKEYRI